MNGAEQTARKILVVEDSETQLELLSRLLAKNGYRVFKAKNGAEGLASASANRPDLVISDVLMPEMDGLQLCRRLKDDEALKRVPVILLTQLENPEEIIRGLEAGADNYISKPYEEEFLLSKIKSIFLYPTGFVNNPKDKCVEFTVEGKRYSVKSSRAQTVALLLSTYENVVRRNRELYKAQGELEQLNEQLEHKVNIRTAALAAEMAERKQLSADLLRSNRELSALYSIYKSAEEKPSVKEMLDAVLRTVCGIQEVSAGAVYSLGPDKETLSAVASIGLSEKELAPFARLKLGEGAAGAAARAMKPVVFKLADYPTKHLAPAVSAIGVKSMVGAPIISGNELVGALSFGSKTDRAFFQEDLNLFAAIGRQIGDMMNAARLYQQLRESEEKLKTIASVAAAAIIQLDEKGVVSYWNPAAENIFGYAKEEVVGRGIEVIIPEKYRESHRTGLEKFLSTGEGAVLGKHVKLSGLRKDGTEIPVDLAVSSFKHDGGWNAVGLVYDISEQERHETSLKESKEKIEHAMAELKKAQEGLIRNEKLAALGHLSAGVAHEIKNPLNIISTSVQLLLMEETLSPGIKEQCNVVLEQVGRAVKITDNLRDFARARKPEMKELDLNELIVKTISLVEYEMKLDNINVEPDLCPAAVVQGDRDQLAQVFLNIINNAADSLSEKQNKEGRERLRERGWKGEIAVKTRAEGPWLVVEFRDTGMGIPGEVMENIFDPFFTTKGERKGTGLGLSIAVGIMENHGGTIAVESREGEWAKFTLRFPALGKSGKPGD
ncbi:MAG: response regulator [Nitrospinae bacterium]|nr:response regulator [Nitrospinota bacterium]